jgi:hypothetical protein
LISRSVRAWSFICWNILDVANAYRRFPRALIFPDRMELARGDLVPLEGVLLGETSAQVADEAGASSGSKLIGARFN